MSKKSKQCTIVYHGEPRLDRSVIEWRTGWLCKQLRLLDRVAPHLIDPDLEEWWKEHKAAHEDLDRRIALDAEKEHEKNATLAKLSPRERELLGLR